MTDLIKAILTGGAVWMIFTLLWMPIPAPNSYIAISAIASILAGSQLAFYCIK